MNRKILYLIAIALVILTSTFIYSSKANAPLTGTITGTVYLADAPIETPTPTATPTTTPIVTPIPTPAPTPAPAQETTIAYLGDARPSKFGNLGITELTNDFNQIIPQSPTGRIDAIMMIGDMDKFAQTEQARLASDVKNVSTYYVMGNHEIDNDDKLVQFVMPGYFTTHPGPAGTEKQTYSVDIGNQHIVNVNVYWDGHSNPFSLSLGSGGGFITDPLQAWINSDLGTTNKFKVVVLHEPLYPKKRHVGDSLDSDTTNRDRLQQSFIDDNVKVLVAAHTHYATVNSYGGVYHVDAGISGAKTSDGEDPYASITYTVANSTSMVLTWKHENPSWSNPKVMSYIIN